MSSASTASLPATEAGRTPWPAVCAVVAAGVVAALQVGKAMIALPALRADLQLNLAQAGWVMSLFALLGVAGGLPVGVAVSRWGDRKVLLLGLAGLAIGSGAGAAAGGLVSLLASRVLEGLGFLLVIVAAPALLQRLAAPREQPLVMGLWSCFMPVGIAVALLAGPLLQGWRGIWVANAVLCLLACAGLLAVVRRGPAGDASATWRGLAADTMRTLRARTPVLLALVFACYTLQYLAIFSFLPVMLMERMDVSVARAGVLSAVAVAANIAGNLGAGALLARGVNARTLILFASVVMGLCGVGAFLPATPPMAVFVLCVLFSGLGGLVPATVLAIAPGSAGEQRLSPVCVGLSMQGNNLGQVAGPALVGWAAGASGWGMAAVPVGLAAAGAAVLALMLREPGKEKPANR